MSGGHELEGAVAAIVAAGDHPPASAERTIDELLEALERGEVRAAERDRDGVWHAVAWVKQGILLAFKLGDVVDMSPIEGSPFQFYDKHTLPTQDIPLENGVRIVPGGSTVRRGAHLARGVVCMPPMYINAGAWVGAGTMVDSHALVGSCAQIGERVHLSAAAQIGGVLEPVNAAPVVVEDDAFIGGNCGVYEGTVVRRRAVLAPGVLLTRGTPVYDLVHEKIYRAGDGGRSRSPKARWWSPARGASGKAGGQIQGLSLATPVIVKYRDESTNAGTALESALR